VLIDGKPNVYVNCSTAASANVPTLPAARAPKPPGGPGTGGATIDPQSKLSGQGKVEAPGGFQEVSIDLSSLSPPPTPDAAPSSVSIGAAAAAAIGAAVSGAAPVVDAVDATRTSLVRDELSSVTALAEAGQLPTGQQMLGPVLSSPITGSMTGSDLAGLVSQGQQVGIFHLAGGAASSAAGSALPPGVDQFMAMRTQAAPPALDGGALDNAFAQNRVLGLSTADAQAAALHDQGVALFQGNGAGVFTKLPGSGLPGLG
jgi:type VI secretion system secreted protein VgrG